MFISTAIVNVLPLNKPTLEEANSIVLLEQSVQMCVTQCAVFCASFYRFARYWENKNVFFCARLNRSVLPFFSCYMPSVAWFDQSPSMPFWS